MNKGRVAWLVPPLKKGSGGHRTIFQNINYAVQYGYDCDIYFEEDGTSLDVVKRNLTQFFGKSLATNIYLGEELRGEYDLLMATGWHTTEAAQRIVCPRKAYFIQDYEPWFYPVGANYLTAKNSYHLGYRSITIGRWLSHQIQTESKTPTAYFDFCADLDVYHYDKLSKEDAICCIYQPKKDRRCGDLLLRALRIVKEQRPQLNIYLYGSTDKAQIDFAATELGIITPEECNDLYNRCKLGISMSATNPSRIPFEMMAAGLPVVELYRDNNLYDLPDSATLLAVPNPISVAQAILELLDNSARRTQMSQAGVDFMRERPLELGYQQFITALDAILTGDTLVQESPQKLYQQATAAFAASRPNPQNQIIAKSKHALSEIKHKGAFLAKLAQPKNFAKAYKLLKNGGVGEFKNRLKARLQYQYADQRYQYQDFLRLTRPTTQELEQQRKTHFNYRPCFGVAIPLYNTKPEYLQDLLDGFKAQTYTNFKLFMVDASPAEDGKTILTDRMCAEAEADPRIIYRILDQNEGIAGNTNQAIQLALADSDVTHIALCDHDDFVEPDAFYQYAKVLNKDQNVKIIYSDEDVVRMKDDPEAYYVMKPDFNPYLLESCNYINHFFVCEKALLGTIKTKDGLYEQPAYDGAQDYDLYLRLVEKVLKLDQKLTPQETEKIKSAVYTSSTIYHVPKVLYHWRAAENSTAQDPHNKLYAFDAGKRALEAYYQRRKIAVSAVEYTDVWGTYRTKYNLSDEPLISVIIPNKDHAADLKKAIESVKQGTYQNLEFIIVENNSTEAATFAYYDELKSDKQVKVVYYEGEYNYSAVNNYGVQHASGDVLLLLNNDIEMIAPDSIREMLAILERKSVGAVGAKLLFPDGEVQHAGVIVGFGGSAGHIFYRLRPEFSYGNRANCVANYSAVTAACLLVRKSTYEQVNGFDEDFAVTFNDVDFCLKIRAFNELIVYTPHAQFYHHESKSRGVDTKDDHKRKRMEQEAEHLRTKWPEIYRLGDPYYNPNFTLRRFDCSLKEDLKESPPSGSR